MVNTFTPKEIAEFVSQFSNLNPELLGKLHKEIHTTSRWSILDDEQEERPERFWESLPQDETCDYSGRAAEAILSTVADQLTFENWKTILSTDWSYLFQRGTPHINWSTDRYDIACAYIRNHKGVEKINVTSYESTWRTHTIEFYSIPDNDEYALRIETESPRSYDIHSFTRYNVSLIERAEVPARAEYLVIALAFDKYGSVGRSTESFSGTLEECIDFVSRKNLSSYEYKIIDLLEYAGHKIRKK